MEAAIRTAYEIVTGREVRIKKLHVESVIGLEGVKKSLFKNKEYLPDWKFLEGVELKVGVAHGLGNARKIIEEIKKGEEFHFVE